MPLKEVCIFHLCIGLDSYKLNGLKTRAPKTLNWSSKNPGCFHPLTL